MTVPELPHLPALPKPEPQPPGPRRVTLQLGSLRCTFVLHGEPVTQIDVIDDGACRAATIFRTADEPKNTWFAGLNGNTLEAEEFSVADWNFDGFADLAVMRFSHPKGTSWAHWLFDPRRGTWVRSRALDELAWPSVDESGTRLVCVWEAGDATRPGRDHCYRWQGDRLVSAASEGG